MLTVPPLPSSNSVADWPAIIRRRASDILHLPWRSRAMRLTLKRDEKPLRVPWAGARRRGRAVRARNRRDAERRRRAPRANSSAPRGSETRGRRRGALVAAGPGNGRERAESRIRRRDENAPSLLRLSFNRLRLALSTALPAAHGHHMPPVSSRKAISPRSPRTARASASNSRSAPLAATRLSSDGHPVPARAAGMVTCGAPAHPAAAVSLSCALRYASRLLFCRLARGLRRGPRRGREEEDDAVVQRVSRRAARKRPASTPPPPPRRRPSPTPPRSDRARRARTSPGRRSIEPTRRAPPKPRGTARRGTRTTTAQGGTATVVSGSSSSSPETLGATTKSAAPFAAVVPPRRALRDALGREHRLHRRMVGGSRAAQQIEQRRARRGLARLERVRRDDAPREPRRGSPLRFGARRFGATDAEGRRPPRGRDSQHTRRRVRRRIRRTLAPLR